MTFPEELPLAEAVPSVRERTLDVLARLTSAASRFELPAPPDALDRCRQKLEENQYLVLVAGEAKRGKSSFVNAVIGRPILPTDVSVATSQVFRVRQAPREAYRVLFQNDSVQTLTREELPLYGSQTAADAGEMPRLDQVIRWIEIDGPIRFLPPEIALLDTPGLGSLYAAHARVTNQYVPLADAVIFTLGSDSPVGQSELKFLEDILAVTPHVFFIQTMIDRYRREDWQGILDRNRQLLTERLGGRLRDVTIWPVSSKNLMKAAQTGDPDYEEVSRFRPLAEALRGFLYRAAGRVQVEQALVIADALHRDGTTALVARKKSLVEESAAERAARVQAVNRRKREFQQEWGDQGAKRGELSESAQRVARASRLAFQSAIAPGGPIAQDLQKRIDDLGDLAEATPLGERLTEVVADRVESQWRSIRLATEKECQRLLGEFLANVDRPETGDTGADLGPARRVTVDADVYGMLRSTLREGGSMFSVAATGATVAAILVPAVVGSVLFAPLAVGGAFAAGIYGAWKGYSTSRATQLREAKQMLEKSLRDVLARVNTAYFSADVAAGRFSSVADAYFDQLLKIMSDAIAKVVATKTAEAEREVARLDEEGRLDDGQRKLRAEEYDRRIAEWAAAGDELGQLITDVKAGEWE